MPSSRAARLMRTAISPRLAMSSRENAISGDLDQRLAGHHRLFILDKELHDLAGSRPPALR